MMNKLLFCDEMQNRDTVFVACSGGVDSVVLVHALKGLGFQVSVLHCNFKLRDKDSEDDQAFVKEFCEQLNVPYFIKNFDTKAQKKNKNQSIQKLARNLRYGWFDEILGEHQNSIICTAHHADDNEEQIWLRLISSGRILDLGGIPAKRDQFLRPMLKISKNEIVQYAEMHKLSWREDQSNTETNYTRNKIRLNLKPVLDEIDPRHGKAIQRFSSELEQLRQESIRLLQAEFGSKLTAGEFFVPDEFWVRNLSVVKEILLEFWMKSNSQLPELERFYQDAKPGSTLEFRDGHYVIRENAGLWFGHEKLDHFEEISIDLSKIYQSSQLESHFQVLITDLQERDKLPKNNFKSLVVKKTLVGETVQAMYNRPRKIKKIWNDEAWMHHQRRVCLGFYVDDLLCFIASLRSEKS